MKRIVYLIMMCCVLGLLSSCDNSIDDNNSNKGYLRVNVGTVLSVNTPKTRIEADYNPKQIAVKIINAAGTTVKETNNSTNWEGTQIELEPGVYTVSASSNGFDGSESGFDIPYYAGSEQVTVQKGREISAKVTCTLANVKVTVNYDQTFIETFQSAKATVSSAITGINSLDFEMGTTSSSAYFPVGDLTAAIAVVNKTGKSFNQSRQITNVKARDHYILNYKVAESGSTGGVKVEVDDNEKEYTYTFEVSTEATTKLKVSSKPNVWSRFAMLEGEIVSSIGKLDDSKMTFEYQLKGASTWTAVAVVKDGETFKANVKGLEPSSDYSYRIKYADDTNEFVSDVVSFTTDGTPSLPNGSMDNWYKPEELSYPATEADYNANNGIVFWGSSNVIASGMTIEVTTGNSSIVHTTGGKSAQLASKSMIVKFAAASLYTGKNPVVHGFTGAEIEFGKPFVARPTQFHGWFQYSAGTIDFVGSSTPSELGIVKNKTIDNCAIYIAMTTQTYNVDNSVPSTFIDFENDPGIIAYGEVPLSECVSTNGTWKEINIDLKYHDLITKPTHILIVFSASRYGDYFTGSSKSKLYLDDLELIYGDSVVTK